MFTPDGVNWCCKVKSALMFQSASYGWVEQWTNEVDDFNNENNETA